MFQEVLERAKGLALALIQKSTQTNKQTNKQGLVKMAQCYHFVCDTGIMQQLSLVRTRLSLKI